MKHKRLIAAFTLTIISISFLGIYATKTSRKIGTQIFEEVAHFQSITIAATRAASYAKRAEGHLMLYLSLNNPIDKEKVASRLKSLNEQIDILDQTVTTPIARSFTDGIRTLSSDLLQLCTTLINKHEKETAQGEPFSFKDHQAQILALHSKFSTIRKLGVQLTEYKVDLEHDCKKLINQKASLLRTYFRVSITLATILALYLIYLLFNIIGILKKEITERQTSEIALESERDKLEKALSEIKTLSGLLPICSSCKKVRDDKGYWSQIESYIQDHSNTEITHSICPECSEKLYGNEPWYQKIKDQMI